MDAKFLQVSCKLRHYYTNLFSFLKLNLNFSIPQCLLQKYSEVTEESSSQVQAFSGLLTCKNQPSDSVDSILNSSSANVTQKCVLFFNPILKDKYWIVIISKWCKLGFTLVAKAEVQRSQYEQSTSSFHSGASTQSLTTGFYINTKHTGLGLCSKPWSIIYFYIKNWGNSLNKLFCTWISVQEGAST